VTIISPLLVNSTDFLLDSPERRKNNTPHRRALVHGFNDELVLNFGGDYPGGVTINSFLNVDHSALFKGSVEIDGQLDITEDTGMLKDVFINGELFVKHEVSREEFSLVPFIEQLQKDVEKLKQQVAALQG
jgi:hypothetical protein